MAVFVLTAGNKRYSVATGPRAPTDLVALAISSSVIRLTWVNRSTSATDIEIDRSPNGSTSWTTIDTIDPDLETYDDTGRVSNTQYFYRIRALGTPANSSYTAVADDTTPGNPGTGTSVSLTLFPERLTVALAKAGDETAQALAFRARVEALLDEVIESDYYWNGTQYAYDFAAAYHLYKELDPAFANSIGGKAVGLALSSARDNHSTSAGTWQTIGDGNGSQVDFTLPGISIISGTLVVHNLPIASPNGTSGGLVSPSDYTVVGTTLTFDVAPASGRRIWVICLYNTATLERQQTGDGAGGIAFITANTDSAYPDRYLAKAIGAVVDWCQDLSGFTTELQEELLDFLVDASDMSKDIAYANTAGLPWTESNYGLGRIINRVFAAIVVQGRHAEASRLKSEVTTMYISGISPKFINPTAIKSSLKGGFPGEGLYAYGVDIYEHMLLAIAALAETDWSLSPTSPSSEISTWAGECIRFLLHARYDETANTSIGGQTRPGSAVEWGDDSSFPSPCVPKSVFALASGITTDTSAAAYARYLINNKSGDTLYDVWDLLFRDPTATATNWVSEPTNIGLSYLATGRDCVLARKDWTYTTAWFGAYFGNRGDGDHDEPGVDTILYRGASQLLINAAAFGKRYNSDPSGAWNNFPLIDDGKAGVQYFRWSPSAVFSNYQGNTRPGIGTTAYDDTNNHVFVAAEYRAVYGKDAAGTQNPCTTLERDIVFIPSIEAMIVFDRVETAQASYGKRLNYHFLGTTHPVGSGNITLSRTGGGTGNAIAWNSSAATIKTEVDALYSVSSTVEKKCDGWWIVTLPNGADYTLLTGTATASGAVIEIYDYTAEGDGDDNKVQHIVLAKTVTGVQSKDKNSDRIFFDVNSTDTTLVKTETLIECDQFSTGSLCRRVTYYPNSATAYVRFASIFQVAPTSTSTIDTTVFVTGSSSKLQGYAIGSQVVLFRRTASFTPPDTISFTGSSLTRTWRVTGLGVGTTYTLTGASSATVVANGAGVAVFTTTGSNPSVTISAFTPPASVFGLTRVDTGIATSLDSWRTDNLVRDPSGLFWLWSDMPYDGRRTGYPDIVITHHDSPPHGAGLRIYGNPCVTPGGSLANWTNITTSQYNQSEYGLGVAGGTVTFPDINTDGVADVLCTTGSAAGCPPGCYLIGGQLVVQASGVKIADSNSNYPSFWGDLNADGYVDVYSEPGITPAALNTFADLKRAVHTWNQGTGVYDTTLITRPIPSGIPSLIQADIIAAMKQTQPDNTQVRFYACDIDGDSNIDLVVGTFSAYASQLDKIFWLKSDGAGSYTDNGTAWGLPSTGCFLPIVPSHINCPRIDYFDEHLHRSIDALGTLHLFVAGGSAPGIYKYNGSTFTKASSGTDGLQAILQATTYGGGQTDDYLAQLLHIDWMNRGYVDLIYDTPRNGASWYFTNNGSGVFTQYVTGTQSPNNRLIHWTPQGTCWDDFDGDGKIDVALGGNGGTTVTSGVSARTHSIYRNTTTNPGNYLHILIQRTTGANRFGVGAVIEMYETGTTTLIRKLLAQPFGRITPFGCGARTSVKIRIVWPSGSPTVIDPVTTNQVLTVTS